MKNTLLNIYEKEGTKKVLSSLISILVGLFVGAIVVVIVGLSKDTITTQGIADGVKLIFAGILCTGRNAAGQLAWGFNYYGTVGSNRDEFIMIRKMKNVNWLDDEGRDQVQEAKK